jgi:hypothetical protein
VSIHTDDEASKEQKKVEGTDVDPRSVPFNVGALYVGTDVYRMGGM